MSVVFYPIVFWFFPVQSSSTSGMSIMFLNEQNVSRYYAPQQTTASHHCLQDAERVSISHVRISLLKPRLWFYFYNQSFGLTIKAWNGDKSTKLTGSFSETSSHHIYKSNTHTHTHSRALAIMIQAWRHLSQQQITSALLTCAHVCFRFICRLLPGHTLTSMLFLHHNFKPFLELFLCSFFRVEIY